jgi:hypothetical protein
MLVPLFLHYPRSDCWAGVINLKSDEAGEENRDGRERDPIRKVDSKQEQISSARNGSSRVRDCMCVYAKMKGIAYDGEDSSFRH